MDIYIYTVYTYVIMYCQIPDLSLRVSSLSGHLFPAMEDAHMNLSAWCREAFGYWIAWKTGVTSKKVGERSAGFQYLSVVAMLETSCLHYLMVKVDTLAASRMVACMVIVGRCPDPKIWHKLHSSQVWYVILQASLAPRARMGGGHLRCWR